MTTILDTIIATKRGEIAAAKEAIPPADLKAAVADAPPVRDFFAALAVDGPIRLIAEVKRASPSKGLIREDFDPVEIAKTYEAHGAACVSVLTDVEHFQGSLDYLRQIRNVTNIPVLRKDFIIDRYQLYEARAAGADAVLLIAECLDDSQLRKLYGTTIDLGMTPLVEFYEVNNLERVMAVDARLIGINNRNLHTFETDLKHTIRLRAQIPDDRIVVGESGIHSRADAKSLADAGVQAILVGEHLMAQPDIGDAVDRLLGKTDC